MTKRPPRSRWFLPPVLRLIQLLTVLLILKTVATVLISFRDYFPPNFESDFLLGRESYFFGDYRWAFYIHILSGPCTLVFGIFLISRTMRRRFPKWHRRLGKISSGDRFASCRTKWIVDGISRRGRHHCDCRVCFTGCRYGRHWMGRLASRRVSTLSKSRKMDATLLRSALLRSRIARDRRTRQCFELRCRMDLPVRLVGQLAGSFDMPRGVGSSSEKHKANCVAIASGLEFQYSGRRIPTES